MLHQFIISLSILSGGGNISNNSLFSPLREHSFNNNSSWVGDGIRYGSKKSKDLRSSEMPNYCIFFSLPKTPVGSFNKSNAHTPLVSPLTMIREEDLEVGNLVFDLMGTWTDVKYFLLL